MTGLFGEDLPIQVTLTQQIACVKREIYFRERVYGRRVAGGHMTQKLADKEIAVMKAVLETLRGLKGE